MNAFLIIVIGILLLFSLTGLFSIPITVLDGSYAAEFLSVAEILGLIMILVNGTFISTTNYKISIAAAVSIFIGMAMKILHLPGADEALLISFFAVPFLYLIHFLRKKVKGHLDFLKLLTVSAFFIPAPLVVLHIIPRDNVDLIYTISHSIFWITMADFLVTGIIQKTLFRS